MGAVKKPSDFYENKIDRPGPFLIAGVDEVGRGPLAGPVIAAAVIFPRGVFIAGVTDSKQLTPQKREFLFPLIRKGSLAIGFGFLGPRKIDRLNILQASLRAMEKAVFNLNLNPDLVLIDGNQSLNLPFNQACLIQGDRLSHAIGAASIIAKVVRDKLMESWHYRFPCYNFFNNKGYGTQEHLRALKDYGPCLLHRLTFRGTVPDETHKTV
ncbi:MAG: ribonuclease HII [Thermodesulfobacteriota bacterium]